MTTETEKKAKYSIIPSFFSKPLEIEATDLVASTNSLTKETFINFIGTDGRYYKLGGEYLGMLIINEPTKEDLADFARLIKEADASEKPLKNENKSIYG